MFSAALKSDSDFLSIQLRTRCLGQEDCSRCAIFNCRIGRRRRDFKRENFGQSVGRRTSKEEACQSSLLITGFQLGREARLGPFRSALRTVSVQIGYAGRRSTYSSTTLLGGQSEF